MPTTVSAPRWDLLGFGVVTVDDLLYVDHHPAPGSKMPVRAKQRQGGGLAGTALVAAARLGASTAYCGVLGGDDLSGFIRADLEREGVDCTPLLHDPEAWTYHSIVIVDQSTGDRCIIFSGDRVREPGPERITEELIARARVLFVDHTVVQTGLRAIELARPHHIPVVADIEAVRDPAVLQLVEQTDHLIINTQMARELTGESDPVAMVRALGGPQRACCVVTGGDRGCWYAERAGEVVHFPAFRVQVVDTTGCGDVFHGAYAACLAWGWGVPRAVQVATATAAIKATRQGGRAGIPDLPTVRHFLQEREHHELP